ncbi:MAG: COX15/CtaA family protein [Gemmataceae bacterium]|nr:COX15/CtaA family protein [Gemmata sp.]MDW8196569.1 COX15/CtaA family protein [Gemmataceae bacterium]
MNSPSSRPTPRWLHIWAIICVAVTFLLLVIGQFVTSFGAGMADPVWPTEPWYVFHSATETEKAKFREQFGFFIEHTHRIVGWAVGGLVTVLAFGALWTETYRILRVVAILGAVVVLAGYGDFHRAMMAQRDSLAAEVIWPAREATTTFVGLGLLFVAILTGWLVGSRGAGLRLCAALALVAVMVQGLLGGFRVKLNELVGTDLAAFHGIFAQVVLGWLVTLAVLTARPASQERTESVRRWAGWSALFAAVIFLQIMLGAWVRHFPTPLPQRLHFLTAFLATAVAVWLLVAVFADAAARSRAGWVAWALTGLLVLQLYLGVEAWMTRFGQYTLPELVPVTPAGGAIRSLHALIGSAVWAAALALTLRLWRTVPEPVDTLNDVTEQWRESPDPVVQSV